jgi:hypothetical protein
MCPEHTVTYVSERSFKKVKYLRIGQFGSVATAAGGGTTAEPIGRS